MTPKASAIAILFAALPLAAAAQGEPTPRLEIGYLKCTQTGVGGSLVKATEDFHCVMDSADDSRPDETYTGIVTKWGVNLNRTENQVIRWAVFAQTAQLEPGALEGEYGGLGAEVSLGVGVGVNALGGGADNAITLQPLSVATQTGVGLAAGVKQLKLIYVEE